MPKSTRLVPKPSSSSSHGTTKVSPKTSTVMDSKSKDKSKDKSKSTSKAKVKSSHPESAEEWLEDGIAAEDSGDRWTSVPDKAYRFYMHARSSYQRAIDLSRDTRAAEFVSASVPALNSASASARATASTLTLPSASPAGSVATLHFDASYNLARLYLQMSLVCALLPAPKLAVLRTGRQAHEELLEESPGNVDVKYNLACILMAMVEVAREHVHEDVSDGGERGRGEKEGGASEEVVKEAMELLEACRLSQTQELQRLSLEELIDGTAEASSRETVSESEEAEEGEEAMEAGAEEEVDVTTVVTNDILMDTLITMVECYTQFLDLEDTRDVQAGRTMKRLVEDVLVPQMQAVLPRCQLDDAGTRHTAALHAMQLADLDHSFRIGAATLDAWSDHLGRAMDLAGSIATHCANVDACISLADTMSRTAGVEQSRTWKVLSSGAATQIAKAIDLSTTKAPQLWITRGDVELLRSNIACEAAVRNRKTLMQNAAVYYKRAVSDSLPKDVREKNEAAMKLAIVQGEIKPDVPTVPEMAREEAMQIVRDARADGLFQGSWKLLS